MLPRPNRFHGYNSLRYVYRNGQQIRGPLLSLKHAYNPRRKDYRVGVVVSRRVHKSAVKRNRIRRRIYEVIRLLSERIKPSQDVIFIVYSDQLADLPQEELSGLVLKQMKRAGLLTS